MSSKSFLSSIKERIEKFDNNVIVQSTPFERQESVIIGEEWTIHYVSGKSEFNYTAHRDFVTNIEKKSKGLAKVTPFRFDNMGEAWQFVEQLVAEFPESSLESFSMDKIRDNHFKDDEPIYVEIVIWPVYGYR